ncbi:hypothetical protein SAMN06264855_1273 [Halorubrum vacuolatum]|uniref:Uncharacterized protein n=2 Tax=Halorubrum vacuolatum TaxID=63740 RepID=A0A238Y1A8_HALVU|nr:hypothetical protein SAMN06264855_1273 [Halorubrum vacuolatum]
MWTTAVWAWWKLPFARKRPLVLAMLESPILGALAAKRGGVSLSRFLPPVYPRNLALLLPAVFITGLLILLSMVMFVLPDPVITAETVGWMLVGGVVVFVVRGVEAIREYFHAENYRNHSARTVLLEPFQQLVATAGLVFLAFIGIVLFGDSEQPFFSETLFVSIIFVGKYAADLRAWQLQHDSERKGWFRRLFDPEIEVEPEPVTIPSGEPDLVVRPSQAGVCLDALVQGCRYLVNAWLPLSVLLFGLLISRFLVVLGIIGLVVFVLFRISVYYLRYGPVEYRCYDDIIVVYGRLLETPQARLEASAVTGMKTRQGLPGRVFGTTTVVFATDWEPPSIPTNKLLPEPEDYPTIGPNVNRPLSVTQIADLDPFANKFILSWAENNLE